MIKNKTFSRALKALGFAAVVAVAGTAASCNDDEVGFSPSSIIYQDYLAQVTTSGCDTQNPEVTISAYAALRNTNASGTILPLAKGSSLTANTIDMLNVADNNYNYGAVLPKGSVSARFIFKKSDVQTYTNRIEFKDCPEMQLENLGGKIVNGKEYTITGADLMDSQQTVQIVLYTTTGETQYPAIMLGGSNSFRFINVPAGTYQLSASVTVEQRLQEADNNAGGKIAVSRVYLYSNPVTVEE